LQDGRVKFVHTFNANGGDWNQTFALEGKNFVSKAHDAVA
jgi:hypothetical protein